MKEDLTNLSKFILTTIFSLSFIIGCRDPQPVHKYTTAIRTAEDISIDFGAMSYSMNEDSIMVSAYDIENRRIHVIHRKKFQEFIGGYPNPWIENDIHFELAESTFVKLDVLDTNGMVFKSFFELKLGKGFFKIKPSYVFNTIPNGNYYYRLQFENENIVKKLDIIR